MQQQWSSFRITLLLYIIVLMLPLGFYFVYTSFETIKNDTRIVRQSSWVTGAVGYVSVQKNDMTVRKIDDTLQNIAEWTRANDNSDLYIGAEAPSKELERIISCWNSYKKDLSISDGKCHELAETMALNIEKTVYLKQKKIINIFYISLLLAMALALLMIYLVRVYIHNQMKKHDIHDHDTKLYNKKYFMAELASTCARSVRYNYPLTLLSFTVTNLNDEVYDRKSSAHILELIGGIISSQIRASDVACRYDSSHIMIMLPFTEIENAETLESRIGKALRGHDFMVEPKPEFSSSSVLFEEGETPEACIRKARELCCPDK